ncbi:metallophosphoesterase [Gloeocapsa sp. PCC 73106]|uniref:metallophosphoesterase n=1 Tax=Gloeocapsa sp. PCC 73106 TaxID=102232 RepID=UPI0002AC9B49|nr:metallophosphoesterase [Gloeocapsa sp. PCC 73106]ELR99387.1 putative phosphohydrolase [Gloeocapsa sp. PCC 73106]
MYWTLSEPLSIERLTIAIADLPAQLSGTKLVQLSDFHYDGLRLSEQQLIEVIARSNQENPDLVLLTGDYVTDDPTPIKALATKLKDLSSKLGIYASLGNHDIYYPHSRLEVTQALTQVGITVLWNAIAYPLGPEFPLVGLADFWSGEFKPSIVLSQIADSTPRLVLSHNPDTAAILKQWRVDLQLSGHTHGGQIVIPGLGPAPVIIQKIRNNTPNIIHPWIPFLKECSNVAINWQWAQGWHQIGRNQLYVNRGLGTYFPGRISCPPELTVITLVSHNG